MTKEHKDIMATLVKLFKDNFKIQEQDSVPAAQRLFNLNSSTPRLIIKPSILKGSFLDPPVVEGELASTGTWPPATRFPRGIIPYKPGFKLKPPGRPLDIFIEDPNLRKLLEVPKISEANLDTTVCHTTQAIKVSGTPFPTTDAFQRASLFDVLYSEELVNSALRFIPVLKTNLVKQFGDFNTSSLDFLEKLIGLISLSNQRGIHNQIAAFVANKQGMRNHVLSKLQVPTKTAQMLKNSNFTCEGIFGDLPDYFLSKFATTAGGYLVCKPRHRGASASAVSYGQARGQKRGNYPYQNQSAKRGKPSATQRDFPFALANPKGGGAASRPYKGKGRGQRKN